MTASKTAAPQKAQTPPKDAIALLKSDREAVNQLFTEQNDMFPKAQASSLDMVELGAQMDTRKQALMAQIA